MKKLIFFLAVITIMMSFKPYSINKLKEGNKDFAILQDNYYNERMQLYQ